MMGILKEEIGELILRGYYDKERNI